MVELLTAALLAGLLGSVHCIGMCGAFAASCTRARGGLAAWHLGRILTYAGLGAVAGAVGSLLPGPPWVPGAEAAQLLVWFALAQAGVVPEPRLLPPALTRAGSRAAAVPRAGAQFLFGLVNGLLPCGLVYSALALAIAADRPTAGALAMLAFGVGTLPALSVAALGLRRVIMTSLWRRRLFAVLLLAVGLRTVWMRAGHAGRVEPHRHGAPATSHSPGERGEE
ncbi:MAG: sulfite exporter TauE/SafE family protein [Gemmatimonadetes bacterium]|nr:sulfite exporter TauE/SafE family protein [Gemmatimonadota bacterium]